MKKYIIAVIIAIVLFGGMSVFASTMNTIRVNTWILQADNIGGVGKFIDGNNVCYTYNGRGGGGISCLKK